MGEYTEHERALFNKGAEVANEFWATQLRGHPAGVALGVIASLICILAKDLESEPDQIAYDALELGQFSNVTPRPDQ